MCGIACAQFRLEPTLRSLLALAAQAIDRRLGLFIQLSAGEQVFQSTCLRILLANFDFTSLGPSAAGDPNLIRANLTGSVHLLSHRQGSYRSGPASCQPGRKKLGRRQIRDGKGMGHLQKDMYARSSRKTGRSWLFFIAVKTDILYPSAVAEPLSNVRRSFFLSPQLGQAITDGQTVIFLSPNASLRQATAAQESSEIGFPFNGLDTTIPMCISRLRNYFKNPITFFQQGSPYIYKYFPDQTTPTT